MRVTVIPCKSDRPEEGLWPPLEVDGSPELDMKEVWAEAISVAPHDYPDPRVHTWPHWSPWFGHVHGGGGTLYGELLFCVQIDGTALWHPRDDEITLGGLQRTSDAGLLCQDVTTLFFVCVEGRGDGEELLLGQSWEAWLAWVQAFASAAASPLFSEAWACLKRYYRLWKARRAAPVDWRRLLHSKRRWEVHDLAKLLSIEAGDAQTLLRAHGFVPERIAPDVFTFDPAAEVKEFLCRTEGEQTMPWYDALPADVAAKLSATYDDLRLAPENDDHLC